MMRIAIGILISLVLSGSNAFSQDVPCSGCGSAVREAISKSLEMSDLSYADALNKLQTTDPVEWTDDQLSDYLDVALLRVYFATCLRNHDNPVADFTVDSTSIQSYLTDWPANPLNNWEPIQIRPVSLGFFPGDIAYEICPSSYSSRGYLRSFQYYIFGNNNTVLPPTVHGRNAEWATVLPGTLHTYGVIFQTDAEAEEVKQRLKAITEAMESQVGEDEDGQE